MGYNRNFKGFIWHGFWLALAETFAEKNTVLPGLILLAGGTQTDVGILTSIMIGVPLIAQLLFASYLTSKPLKKPFLLFGVYLRVFAFFGVGFSIIYFDAFSSGTFIGVVFLWMTLFALSGAFAGVSYSDIVGKSFDSDTRKRFFVARQFLTGAGILISAVLVNQLLSAMEYPANYRTAFFTAAALLFVASFGFIALREKRSATTTRYRGAVDVLKKIPGEIRSSPNLRYFIIATNLISFTLILIPFYIGFIKTQFTITENEIGTFLLIQISGMILSNFLWMRLVKVFSFKGMLRTAALLLGAIPLIVLGLSFTGSLTLFSMLFIFTGSAISAQKIAQEGVLIEISTEANRPLYVGIFGTLNLTAALFPLITGLLLEETGYLVIFPLLSALTLLSLPLINRMDCPVDNLPVSQ